MPADCDRRCQMVPYVIDRWYRFPLEYEKLFQCVAFDINGWCLVQICEHTIASPKIRWFCLTNSAKWPAGRAAMRLILLSQHLGSLMNVGWYFWKGQTSPTLALTLALTATIPSQSFPELSPGRVEERRDVLDAKQCLVPYILWTESTSHLLAEHDKIWVKGAGDRAMSLCWLATSTTVAPLLG